jgi:hypothetical protein
LINFDFVEDKEECNKRRSMEMAAIALSAKTIAKGELYDRRLMASIALSAKTITKGE